MENLTLGQTEATYVVNIGHESVLLSCYLIIQKVIKNTAVVITEAWTINYLTILGIVKYDSYPIITENYLKADD